MEVLIYKKDVDILSTRIDYHFEETDAFGAEDGFNIAVGFTAYDNEREQILTPEYGKLVFNSVSWGSNPDGTYYLERKHLRTHNCTEEELGLLEDKSKATFFDFIGPQKEYIHFYHRKLVCINKEDLFLYGEFDSNTARRINIQLIKCTGRPECKNDTEILEFFRDKFLIFAMNQRRFDSKKYKMNSIISESRFIWQRMNISVRETIPYYVQNTKIILQDDIANMDAITELSDNSLFQV